MENGRMSTQMKMAMNQEAAAAAGHTEVKAGEPPYLRRRPLCVCCGATFCILFMLVLIFVILGFTLLKAKQPVLHVDSIVLSQFSAGMSSTSLLPTIVIVFDLNATVYNPNRASFTYTNTTSYGLYHGSVVAEALIPAGKIRSRGKEMISTQVSVKADQIISNPNLLTDFNSGLVPVSTKTTLSGRVNILGVIKRHATSMSTCDIIISISNRTISDFQCSNKLKL